MTTEEKVNFVKEKRAISRFGRTQIVDQLGVSVHEARQLIKMADEGIPVNAEIPEKIAPKTPTVKIPGLSMRELRAKHDHVFITKNTAEAIPQDRFFTQNEFVQKCNFTGGGYNLALNQAQFSPYKGKAGGTVYWGHPDSIKELKNEGVLKDA